MTDRYDEMAERALPCECLVLREPQGNDHGADCPAPGADKSPPHHGLGVKEASGPWSLSYMTGAAEDFAAEE